MFLLLWKVISIGEKSSLRFISVTCDGTSANSKLLRMHCHLKQDDDMNPETDVTYRTHNLFSGTKTDSFTLFLKFHIYQKLQETVNLILVVVNLHVVCRMAECFYYGTILLTYFTKNNNVNFI